LTRYTGRVYKPSPELKAFAKTKILQAGESQELSFTLTPADLSSFSTPTSSLIAEAGDYTVKFGDAQETLVSDYNYSRTKKMR